MQHPLFLFFSSTHPCYTEFVLSFHECRIWRCLMRPVYLLRLSVALVVLLLIVLFAAQSSLQAAPPLALTPTAEPIPTDTPTPLPTDTPTPLPTDTPVLQPTATDVPAMPPTNTALPNPTATPTPMPPDTLPNTGASAPGTPAWSVIGLLLGTLLLVWGILQRIGVRGRNG